MTTLSASFDHIATFDESVAMLGDLCEQGFRVVPSGPYATNAAPEFAQVTDELVRLLRVGPGFYLTGSFTRHPLPLRRHEGGPAVGQYTMSGLTLGPVIDGLLARDTVVDGLPTLLNGFLLRQSRYLNPQTGQWEEASAELKSAYTLATRTLKRSLVRHSLCKFPIGPEALRRVQAGLARLQP